MSSQPTGERSEKPTFKRIKDARERGQVARSRDLASAVSFIAATGVLAWGATRLAASIGERFVRAFNDAATLGTAPIDALTVTNALWSDATLLATLVGPVALAAAALSIGTSVAQTGWVVAPKALEIKWEKLSPSSGIQRFSPKQAGTELAKAIVGLTALGYFCYAVIGDVVAVAPGLASMMPGESARHGWDRVMSLMWRAGLVLAFLAIGDYGIQRWRWYTQLKMTRQEVRDEFKQQDGNPDVRMRVRRVQRDMVRKRMLHAVKTATVVVTNPTHYAVALEYRRETMAAPVVVAKGKDQLALRIKQIAREHDVPVIENVSLARGLYRDAEIGQAIPADLFGAVAEVLAYLVRLKQLVL